MDGVVTGAPEVAVDHVWYVAYGSNLSRERFLCYVVGGRPAGGGRTYPGCRDTTPPVADVGVELSGGLYFAGRSGVWGGGMAFFDPTVTGRVAARAYLLQLEQLVDVVAQEMWREPGSSGAIPRLDGATLTTLATTGRHTLGPGRYETVHQVGVLEGRPMLTFTRPDHARDDLAPPSEPYRTTMITGLAESHGWTRDQAERYLAAATV